eukprot:107737_1
MTNNFEHNYQNNQLCNDDEEEEDDIFDLIDFHDIDDMDNNEPFAAQTVAEEKQTETRINGIPLLRCVENNESIWPNQNSEHEDCKWLDSVIISDNKPPKLEMNTNLIIDLNDHRMGWSKNFIEKITNNQKEKVNHDERYSTRKWNLSNDNKYKFSNVIQKKDFIHTDIAYNLDERIFPHAKTIDQWIGLHRIPIKLRSNKIKIKIDTMKQKTEQVQNEYSQYIPKNANELSAKHDRIVLLEYLEEYPLIIQSTGMTSNITTLYRKCSENVNKNVTENFEVKDGTIQVLDPTEKSPLLGAPRASKYVTIVDNNLYAAPIRSHANTNNLFLLVGNGNTFYVRKINAIFAVGQIQPKKIIYH